jgi:AraC-like DNA-binding protein
MAAKSVISVRFYRMSPPLQPYFTAIYATTIACDDATIVEDYLHPEWAALRFTEGPPPLASVGPGELLPQWPFVANGPTSKSIHFGVTRSRVWGLGLQPAGWAKFIATPADGLANMTVDGCGHPAFAAVAPLLARIEDAGGDAEEIALRINDFFLAMLERPLLNEDQILACQEALRDPEIAGVAELADRLGMSQRSLERLCRRYFGFPPKLLLRRQRFLRSLAQFMLDPSLNWIAAMDDQYHDQAQFVRDFKSFMGLTPRQYAGMPHPILEPIMQQRMADQGAAPQRLDLPTIMRYRSGRIPDTAAPD